MCENAHDRMRLLQICFDMGLDLLPLRCLEGWQTGHALDLAQTCTEDLWAQLALIRGAGQLSITLSWSGPRMGPDIPSSGRSWLKLRQMHQRAAANQIQEADQILTVATEDFGGRRRFESSGNTSRLHILLPRQDLTAATSAIAKIAASLDRPDLPKLSLIMTGLWPAYSFVKAPKATAPDPT
jgi:hypothetical protein